MDLIVSNFCKNYNSERYLIFNLELTFYFGNVFIHFIIIVSYVIRPLCRINNGLF